MVFLLIIRLKVNMIKINDDRLFVLWNICYLDKKDFMNNKIFVNSFWVFSLIILNVILLFFDDWL